MSPLERFIPRFQLTRPSEAEIAGERDRRAAVLLPITKKARPGIMLTHGAASLRPNPGQIALPGGAAEPGQTAPTPPARPATREESGITT